MSTLDFSPEFFLWRLGLLLKRINQHEDHWAVYRRKAEKENQKIRAIAHALGIANIIIWNVLKKKENHKQTLNRSAQKNNSSWRPKYCTSCRENPKTTVSDITDNIHSVGVSYHNPLFKEDLNRDIEAIPQDESESQIEIRMYTHSYKCSWIFEFGYTFVFVAKSDRMCGRAKCAADVPSLFFHTLSLLHYC